MIYETWSDDLRVFTTSSMVNIPILRGVIKLYCAKRALSHETMRTRAIIPYNFTFHATLTMIRSTVELSHSSCCNALTSYTNQNSSVHFFSSNYTLWEYSQRVLSNSWAFHRLTNRDRWPPSYVQFSNLQVVVKWKKSKYRTSSKCCCFCFSCSTWFQ